MKDKNFDVTIQPIAMTLINGQYTCCFKLKSLKLNFSMKHPHAPLENEEDAINQ